MKNLKRKTEQQPHQYQTKSLPFLAPLNGISDRTLNNHHDKLYAGCVDKKNEIENRLEGLGHDIVRGGDATGNTTFSELRALKSSETYTANAVYLHEWYFEILGGDGKYETEDELV